MTTQIPPLKFQPYQAGQSGTLVAVVNLDSATDTTYTIPITGIYNTSNIVPDVVVIFNTQNNGTVMVLLGTVEVDIPPFVRDSIKLSGSTGTQIGVNLTVGKIQLQFYKGTPPVNPQLYNYAGAAAVANSSILQYVFQPINTTGPVTGTFSTTAGPPTILQGASILNLPFTTKSSASILEIQCQVKGTVGVLDGYMLAIFDAVSIGYLDQVNFVMNTGVGINNVLTLLTYLNSPGAGVAMTFDVRLGSNGGNTFFLNEMNNGAAVPVGWVSWFSVKEVLPQQG